MCGVIGVAGEDSSVSVSNIIYEALLSLQHRGQDGAGIATLQKGYFCFHKKCGLIADVFTISDLMALEGSFGIGHSRYATIGSADSDQEVQPFYVNSPYGISLVHNGGLAHADKLKMTVSKDMKRHINTDSDSEILLNIFAHFLAEHAKGSDCTPTHIFNTVRDLHKTVRGGYAVLSLIVGCGMVAFRDPHGIRPLIWSKKEVNGKTVHLLSSESVSAQTLGFELVRDLYPGECLYIDLNGICHHDFLWSEEQKAPSPCLFEYIYLARPDSIIDGACVYDVRLRMGQLLAEKIKREYAHLHFDAIIPIPDSGCAAAVAVSDSCGVSYRTGFFKNRYIGRTFIMPNQALRVDSVRRKLHAIAAEFQGKSILLVDDSIVRGTTSQQVVQMARDMGATKVYLASAAPPIRYPHYYGICMPTKAELVAHNLTEKQIAEKLGADEIIYQDLQDVCSAIQDANPKITQFETSCFNGNYISW